MRAFVVEHDPLSTPERVGAHLEKRGFVLEPFVVVKDVGDPEIEASFPDGESFDLVVLMGSPWSVYDHGIRGWLLPELEFIERQMDHGVPILGICFGAQAISAALGGRVTMSQRPEYGWVTIDSLVDEIAAGPWFQFHHDEFTLPEGAVERGRNESGLQAFTIGRSLAVQFHPEMSGELIKSWCEAGGDEELVTAGVDPHELIEESYRLAVDSQPALERMLDWYLDDVAGGH